VLSWPKCCCSVYVRFGMCVCDVWTDRKQCYTNRLEEKFWGLVGYMVKMLKLNFPTQNNHFWRTGACATRNDQIFVVFFIHGWHGGGRKGVICMAENKYYWNLSCYSTTLSVCNVFQEVWLQYEKVWGLQWVIPPQGLRGPQKQAKIGGVVWASKILPQIFTKSKRRLNLPQKEGI